MFSASQDHRNTDEVHGYFGSSMVQVTCKNQLGGRAAKVFLFTLHCDEPISNVKKLIEVKMKVRRACLPLPPRCPTASLTSV
jgi:hypothetical protein